MAETRDNALRYRENLAPNCCYKGWPLDVRKHTFGHNPDVDVGFSDLVIKMEMMLKSSDLG